MSEDRLLVRPAAATAEGLEARDRGLGATRIEGAAQHLCRGVSRQVLAEPGDGAVLLFQADDPSAVEAFVRADPYVTGGVVTRWRIRPWTVVVGSLVPPER